MVARRNEVYTVLRRHKVPRRLAYKLTVLLVRK